MFKLLITDDEFIEIQALKHIILNSSLPISEIKTANNGRDAIKIASSFTPDIIIMDIKMPGITGIDAASSIISLLPNCKIIFLSAYDYFDYAKNALQIGASDFLVKPVSNESLLNTLIHIINDIKAEITEKEQQLSIQSKFTQITNYFEYELINYLLLGKCEKSQINEYLSSFNIKYNYINCLIFEIDSSLISQVGSSLRETMLKRKTIKILKEHLNTISIKCLGNYNNDIIYMLLLSENNISNHTIIDLLSSTYQYINTNLFIKGRIIISPSFEDIMLIQDTFLKLKHFLFTNSDIFSVVSYKEELISSNSSNNNINNESKLIESILLCNKAKSFNLANEFITWLFAQKFSTETIRHHIYELLIFINKSINLKLNEHNCYINLNSTNFMKQLTSLSTKAELCSYIYEQITFFIATLKQKELTSPNSIADKVCEYIDTNYMHNITLENMSSMVGLSSHYFSKIFKAEKDLTFSEYLCLIRIKESKKLLKNTNLTVSSIGLQVGYNDPNYFTRVFKRSESLTPKEYRTAAKNYLKK